MPVGSNTNGHLFDTTFNTNSVLYSDTNGVITSASANSINSLISNVDAFGNLTTSAISGRIQLQFPYVINSDLTTSATTGNGTVTHSAPFAICSTTAATNSSARLSSKANLHYRTGQGCQCIFSAIFTTGVANSVQEVGIGDDVNGLFFGFNGISFGINRRSNSVDNYIPQTSWNKDKMDGNGPSNMLLDPTKGNVFKIQYQWLGFGALNFFIENQFTGLFILVHQISYSNQNTVTSVTNPSMPLTFKASNTSNNTNVVVKVASIAALIEGLPNDTGIVNCINNSKSNVTTELNILTIRNNATFGGITNRKFVQPLFVNVTNTSNSNVLFRIVLNATLGGTPSYTDISTNTSVVSYDVAGTTVTGGRLITALYVNGNTQSQIDLNFLSTILNNSDTLTISATSLGAAIVASTAVSWSEGF